MVHMVLSPLTGGQFLTPEYSSITGHVHRQLHKLAV